MLSPEVDLLDALCGQDETLSHGLDVFKGAYGKDALERIQKVLWLYIGQDLVQLIHVQAGTEHVLKTWQVRPVLANPDSWTLDRGDTEFYLLRITDKGYKAYVHDSKGFFAKLFAKE